MFEEQCNAYFREFMLDHCSNCLWDEFNKPEESWDRDAILFYIDLMTFTTCNEKASVKEILEYMRKLNHDEEVIECSRATWKYFVDNLTEDLLMEVLEKMDRALAETDESDE